MNELWTLILLSVFISINLSPSHHHPKSLPVFNPDDDMPLDIMLNGPVIAKASLVLEVPKNLSELDLSDRSSCGEFDVSGFSPEESPDNNSLNFGLNPIQAKINNPTWQQEFPMGKDLQDHLSEEVMSCSCVIS